MGIGLLACLPLARAADQGDAAHTSLASARAQRGQPLTAAEREARLAKLRASIRLSVDDLDKRLERPDGGEPSLRDLPYAALAKLLLGQDPRQAEALLRREWAQQDSDPGSPAYGTIPWQIGHPEIKDANAIEFGCEAVGPILLHYGDRLSPAFKKEIVPHIQAAFAAIRRHNVPVSYTNIYLMKSVNLILMGEAIGDRKAAADGYAQLEEWIGYTRRNGIHEFDSPTYYSVDLNCLLLGYRYAARPEGRAEFKTILDYFWTDIASNYFAGRGSLSGPHSRDYDFLGGSGGIDLSLYVEGLRSMQTVEKIDLEKACLLEGAVEAGYHPDAEILALAALPERVVRQRWDPQPERDRYNYITPDFAIGSACGDYNAQDKMISVELASSKNLPVLSLVPDPFDAPYGRLKVKGRDGHSKAYHMPLSPTVVQKKGALLALLDLDAPKARGTESFATNVLLPARADSLILDGKPAPAEGEFAWQARSNSVVGVREGNAGVAIRIFRADGCAGQDPVFVLKADGAGLKYGAARFAVYHYRGAGKPLTERHVRVGLLLLAAPCEDDHAFSELLKKARDASIEEQVGRHIWQVTARVGALLLEAGRDPERRRILSRRVDGQDVSPERLSVNGQDYASRLFHPRTKSSPLGTSRTLREGNTSLERNFPS